MSANPDTPALVEWETLHVTFRGIWQAAHDHHRAEQQEQHRRFASRMAALVLAHAAYEGFINDAIQHLRPDIWKVERSYFRSGKHRGVMGRTRFLAAELGIALASTSRPYRTVAELSAWRNDLVHPQSALRGGTMSARAYAKRVIESGPVVFSKLRPAFARRCFEDAADLAQLLLEGAVAAGRDELGHLGDTALWGPLTIGQGSLKK